MYREYLRRMGCGPSTGGQPNDKTLTKGSTTHLKSPKDESGINTASQSIPTNDNRQNNSKTTPAVAETKKETEQQATASGSGQVVKAETKKETEQQAATSGSGQVLKTETNDTTNKTKLSEEQKAKAMKDLDALKKQSDDLMKMIQEAMSVLENSVRNDAVYQGNVSKEISSPAKIIRIFTSSTFTDTKYERNRMMETTYPHLKAYCQQKGFEFQIVDMRWGIRDEATNDHMTTEICLQEIANCQKYSAGPNFLSLLSHKYGYRTLPRKINADNYEKIIQHVDSSDKKELLSKWYKKDENCVPSMYILQPISANLPDFVTKEDKNRQTEAKKQWWEESDAMLDTLIAGAEKALSSDEAYKFKVSVTHAEIMSGVLKTKQDVAKKCVWVRRNITDIDKQQPSYQLSRFTECNGPDEKLDMIRHLMNDLKRDMSERLPAENILTYEVSWQERGLDPSIQEHNTYLEKICEDSERKLKQLVDGIIAEDQKKMDLPFKEEIKQHILFCQGKIADFQGKEDILKIAEEYVKGKSPYPLVIHGASGSGKTSLMAMIAKKSFEWMEGKGTVVIRFLGTTPKSSNLFDLLINLVTHIRHAKTMDPLRNTNKLTEASLALKATMFKVKDPLVVILDSLDQMDPSYNARELAWLPTLFKANVKLIVSTLEDPEYEAFPALQAKLKPECFVPVSRISDDDVKLILKHWLARKERILTKAQENLILQSFKQCPLPLYLNLCFLEASQWPSYLNISSIQLFKTVREAINGLFSKIETLHGKIFVSRALGYLTAAKIGLTETELEDILSCDDDVLNDVYVYWTPPIRRLPPLLLARLRHDLQQYLVERGADRATVIYWYHRQFIEAARERYCQEESSLISLHFTLADFFLGSWANGNKKPYVNRNGESGLADRHVVAQPIKLGIKYNLRKLNNLAYHLSMSNRLEELKSKCLMNPDYLIARLESTSLSSVVEDFEVALKRSKDNQLDLILQSIRLSEDALIFSPAEFIPQMVLRLQGQKEVQLFLDTCKRSEKTYLLPDSSNLVKVGGPLVFALGGHKSQVEWVDMKKDGKMAVTAASEDNTLGLWDIKEGRLIRLLEQVANSPNEVHFVCNDSSILIYDSQNMMLVNELGSKKLILKHEKMNCYCICGEDKDILVWFMKNNTVSVFDLKKGEKITEIRPFESLSKEDWKKKAFGLVASGSRNHAVCVNDDENMLWVVDLSQMTAYCSDIIKWPYTEALKDWNEEDISIDAFTVSPDCKHLILSNIFDNIPYLLDIKTFERKGCLQGDKEDILQEYKLSPDGKTMYAKNKNNVLCIDLQTGKREVVISHTDEIDCVVSVDMKTFVTVSSDCILRVWDTSRKEVVDDDNSSLKTMGSVKSMTNCPNGRYMLLIGESNSKEDGKSLCLYDMYKKNVVSEAKYKQKIVLKNPTFVDDWKVVVEVEDNTSENSEALDLHLIDLETMIVTPIPGKMFKHLYSIVKVSHEKELLVPTRSGKNLKFYNLQTMNAEYILNIPPEFGKRADGKISVNRNGTLVALTDSENEQILVVDVEKRCIKSLFYMKQHKIGFINNDFLLADDQSFFVFIASIEGSNNLTMMFLQNLNEDKLMELEDVELIKKMKKRDNSLDVENMLLLNDDTIFSSHDDKLLRVWSTRTGSLLQRIKGHRSNLVSLYFTPESPYILTYGEFEEQTLFVWNKITFKLVASFKLDESVNKITWCEDGLSFITANTWKDKCPTRWMLHGKDLPAPKDDLPENFISTIAGDNIPTLTFKKINHDPNDLDQEDECPETDDDDDDEEEEEDTDN